MNKILFASPNPWRVMNNHWYLEERIHGNNLACKNATCYFNNHLYFRCLIKPAIKLSTAEIKSD